MSNKGHRESKRRVLADHTQQGKRFVPPLAQLGLSEVRWPDDILPELLWLGLLNARYGLERGAALGLALARAAFESTTESTKVWFAVTSNYASLEAESQTKIVAQLRSSRDLEALQEALMPLFLFYPECPLNFLFRPSFSSPNASETSLGHLKSVLETLFDRWDKPATLMQADAIYIAFVTGLLKVHEGLSLANFPVVADFPDTEESLKVAGAVRATISGFFGSFVLTKASPWPSYFWNRGLLLEPCNLRSSVQ